MVSPHIIIQLGVNLVQNLVNDLILGNFHHIHIDQPQRIMNIGRVNFLVKWRVLLNAKSLIGILELLVREPFLDVGVEIGQVAVSLN